MGFRRIFEAETEEEKHKKRKLMQRNTVPLRPENSEFAVVKNALVDLSHRNSSVN